jgi:glycosyltransferase involved in cell wall biosynthesis
MRALASEPGGEATGRLAGHLRDVPPVNRDHDVPPLTSHIEKFPGVGLEALCMEVPVLATNLGGMLELVVDGRTGIIVPGSCSDPIEAARPDSDAWRVSTATPRA